MSERTMHLLEDAIPVFSVLADKTRQEILLNLFDNGEQTVSEITGRLKLTQPAVSYHLKLLMGAKLVNADKRGRERYYTVRFDDSVALLDALLTSLKSDAKQIDD
ncbi:ArsR/SmtB family transcription factor [Furfurilactobacillus curtus]|uniref:ArsR/SmtB family transcription factor n=1 Tax=Furfurilactobacillus curtus TaxID=1746200 RepID=UPI0038B2D046